MNFFMQYCRLCTSDKNISFSIHNLDSDGKGFIYKLETIIPEIVDCKIKLPNGLCTICAVQLNEAYIFIKQCYDSQTILKQHLNEQLCRLCASNKNISLTLNSTDADNILLSYKLETIESEILKCSEKLPDLICAICFDRLNETYKFKVKCIKSHEILKQFAQQQDDTSSCLIASIKEEGSTLCIKEEIVKEEYVKPDLENDTNIVEESLESESNTNFETVFIKEETINEEDDRNIKTEENSASFETVFIREDTSTEKYSKIDLENDANIKMEENSEEDISDSENETDFKSDQTDININKNDSFKLIKEMISLNKETFTMEKSYQCLICERIFSQRGHISRHILTHSNEKSHKCEICGKAFTQNEYLRRHRIRSHANVKPYQCEICEKSFPTNGHLKLHLRYHIDAKKYKCEICEKAFSTTGILQMHIRVHSNETPYRCKICEKPFIRSQNLKSHMRSHTNNRPFKCETCGKTFKGKNSLTIHVRVHTQEKPYKCKICEKSFAQTGGLTKHNRIHTKEKPYKCEICERAFTEKGHLRRHISVHTKK